MKHFRGRYCWDRLQGLMKLYGKQATVAIVVKIEEKFWKKGESKDG